MIRAVCIFDDDPEWIYNFSITPQVGDVVTVNGREYEVVKRRVTQNYGPISGSEVTLRLKKCKEPF
jgi:hypothetical protein